MVAQILLRVPLLHLNANVDTKGATYSNISYSWDTPGGSTGYSSNSSLSINNFGEDDAGTYELRVNFDGKIVESNTLSLSLMPDMPVITQQPSIITLILMILMIKYH